MTEREKMVKAVKQIEMMRVMRNTYEECADYLIRFLASELNLLPFNVGDKVYQHDSGGKIYESTIKWFYYDKDYKRIVYDCDTGLAFDVSAVGQSVFLTSEEAEKVLKERKKQ